MSLQYDKTLYLLEDLPEHRQLIHRYIEVAEYPDGAIELWADDTSLPYTTHYRYPDVDQAAIVENKRLGHVLGIEQKVQALRDNRHYEGPSRTMSGVPPGPQPVTPGARRQRQINRLALPIEEATKRARHRQKTRARSARHPMPSAPRPLLG